MDLITALEKSVSEHPERDALITEDHVYSYRELVIEARKAAAYLEATGLGGEKIAFSGPNSGSTFITILGVWYSGGTCVHANPRLEKEELSYYLEDSEASALFYHEDISQKVESIEDELSVRTESFHNIRSDRDYSREKSDQSQELCSITYTSGTTGKPKGVPYRHTRLLHGSIVLIIEAQQSRGKPVPVSSEITGQSEKSPKPLEDRKLEKFIASEPWKEDTHAVLYPLYHISGTNPSFATLLGGGTLVLPDREIEKVMETIERESVTLSGGVPAQLKEMAEKAEDSYNISSLEYIHTGGGLLTDQTMREINQSLTDNLCHEYASSETLEMAYSLDNSGSLGNPTCLQELKIVKPGTLQEVDEGEKGEVIVNTDGPTVFTGYWNKPEKTAESIEEGWYRTGDLARKDEEGKLWFEGRADDLIISGGENISPAEVENKIVSHESVNRCGVIGVEDDEWGQRSVAFVGGEDIDIERLDRYLKDSELANFKRPKEYIKVDKVPEKETSGVDRRKLRQIYDQQT